MQGSFASKHPLLFHAAVPDKPKGSPVPPEVTLLAQQSTSQFPPRAPRAAVLLHATPESPRKPNNCKVELGSLGPPGRFMQNRVNGHKETVQFLIIKGHRTDPAC